MKTKSNTSIKADANNGEMPKQKERHIVSWSQEEDDILREQIRLHGTENWAIIASKFKDKTTRQCRRRWFTYLNSDFKKGGWSPEEDVLLCEAQKIFGNRWTEIAKVVSGRTDNAVKNRFTTLCKKRAKHEVLAKENSTTNYINLNNKRVIFRNEGSLKKIRAYVSNKTENCEAGEKLERVCGAADHLRRHPLSVVAHRADFPTQPHADNIKETSTDESTNSKTRGTFLKKDNPKVLALMQQAELLSSLAVKVNTDKTDQSLENAWMVLDDFLKQNKETDFPPVGVSDNDFEIKKFKELVEELRSCTEGSRSSLRERDAYESSPASSEYSTGSTVLPNAAADKTEECEAEIGLLHQDTVHELQSKDCEAEIALLQQEIVHELQTNHLDDQHCPLEETEVKNMLTCKDMKADNMEFSSPIHVTPLFRAMAAAIPSPKFSESEKHFLMKTLGMDSTSQSPITNPPQPPPCKRSLLHCL